MLRDSQSLYLWLVIVLACLCAGILHQGESLEEKLLDRKSSVRGTRDAKPLFVLHVGPPKTGTTSIQHFADTAEEVFEEDNFYYLGTARQPETKFLHEIVRNCRDGIHPDCQDKWDEFKSIVQEHYKRKHNLFMSEEMLNVCRSDEEEQEYLWDNLVPLLSEWGVRVVFTYRHLHDWVPSKYSQAYSFHITDRRQEKVQNWPDHGGRVIRPFPDFFDVFMKRPFHLPLPIRKRWGERYDDIAVFDMDNTTNVLRDFYCNMIPEARNLCKFTKSEDFVVERLNPSSSRILHFDMLAVAAYRKGWINDSLSRRDVTRAAEKHAQDIGYTEFPMICLSPEKTNSLYQDSLAYAKEMFPQLYSSSDGEKEFRLQFDEAVDAGKFCSVDAQETLQQTKWKNFFLGLSSNNVRPEDSS